MVSNEVINMKAEKDDMEFAHQYFVQGQDRLLEFIKRKVVFYIFSGDYVTFNCSEKVFPTINLFLITDYAIK